MEKWPKDKNEGILIQRRKANREKKKKNNSNTSMWLSIQRNRRIRFLYLNGNGF